MELDHYFDGINENNHNITISVKNSNIETLLNDKDHLMRLYKPDLYFVKHPAPVVPFQYKYYSFNKNKY